MSLFRYFKNPFVKKAMVRLIDYGNAQLRALTADNPGAIHAARIAAMTTAFGLLDDGMEDVETKGAIQAGKVTAKNLFRVNTVPETVARAHAAVVLHFGAESADMAERFPHGKEVFRKCKDQELDDHLGQLHTCVAARTAALGAILVADVAAMETTWASCIGDVGGAVGNVEMVRAARLNAKRSFANELFLTLLHLASKYPDDEVKFAQYVPEHLLEAPATPAGPGAATLSAGAWNATTHLVALTMQSDGATVFTLQRRAVGETTWTQVLDDIGADAEGNATFEDEVPTGHYEYRVIPRNGDGVEGDPSNVVTVHAV